MSEQRKIEFVKDQKDIARIFKTERKRRGIVQKLLAGMLRLNRRTIIDLEKAEAVPSFATVQKVASALGYKVAFVPKEAEYYASRYEGENPSTMEIEGEEITVENIVF